MRWGKIAMIGLTAVVGLGLGLIVAEPWDGPTAVDALELDDEAWREDDAFNAEVGDDDDDDDNGTRTRSGNGGGGNTGAAGTDDGRDGTREGDTVGGQGTGTGNTGGGANTGGATNTGGGDT